MRDEAVDIVILIVLIGMCITFGITLGYNEIRQAGANAEQKYADKNTSNKEDTSIYLGLDLYENELITLAEMNITFPIQEQGVLPEQGLVVYSYNEGLAGRRDDDKLEIIDVLLVDSTYRYKTDTWKLHMKRLNDKFGSEPDTTFIYFDCDNQTKDTEDDYIALIPAKEFIKLKQRFEHEAEEFSESNRNGIDYGKIENLLQVSPSYMICNTNKEIKNSLIDGAKGLNYELAAAIEKKSIDLNKVITNLNATRV